MLRPTRGLQTLSTSSTSAGVPALGVAGEEEEGEVSAALRARAAISVALARRVSVRRVRSPRSHTIGRGTSWPGGACGAGRVWKLRQYG